MVMTNDQRGVQCDLCGDVHKDNFTYYSGSLDKVIVSAGRATKENPEDAVDINKRFLDIDMCEKCWKNMRAKIMKVINKREAEAKNKARSKPVKWSIGDGAVPTQGNPNRPGNPPC